MRSAYFIGDDYSRTFSNLMPINFRKTWMKIYYKFTMKLLYFREVYLGSNDSLLISIIRFICKIFCYIILKLAILDEI